MTIQNEQERWVSLKQGSTHGRIIFTRGYAIGYENNELDSVRGITGMEG